MLKMFLLNIYQRLLIVYFNKTKSKLLCIHEDHSFENCVELRLSSFSTLNFELKNFWGKKKSNSVLFDVHFCNNTIFTLCLVVQCPH